MTYRCTKCEFATTDEQKFETHLLFAHFQYMQPCSTHLAEKQHLEAQDLRTEWNNLKRIIQYRINYIKRKFKNNPLAKSYTKNSNPPLKRWLQCIARGEGWLQKKDYNKIIQSKEYAELEPYLIKAFRPSIRKRQIEILCKEKGYIIE